jgi:acyl-CoA thioester hydrolase
MHRTEVDIVIPCHDLDPYEVARHGHYAKYLEIARDPLPDGIDCGRQAMLDSGYVWPIVDLRIQHVRPLRYGQRVRVSATLGDWEYRLRINYLIRDALSLERLSKAYTTQVAVDASTGQMCRESPAVLADKLGLRHC